LQWRNGNGWLAGQPMASALQYGFFFWRNIQWLRPAYMSAAGVRRLAAFSGGGVSLGVAQKAYWLANVSILMWRDWLLL